MFSSRSFIVSGLTFRYLIHFEFIFVYGVRKCSSFILLQVVDQFSQHHLLKRFSLIHCIFLPPLSKIRCPYVCGFISGLLFCSIDLYFCLCASTTLSWWLHHSILFYHLHSTYQYMILSYWLISIFIVAYSYSQLENWESFQPGCLSIFFTAKSPAPRTGPGTKWCLSHIDDWNPSLHWDL